MHLVLGELEAFAPARSKHLTALDKSSARSPILPLKNPSLLSVGIFSFPSLYQPHSNRSFDWRNSMVILSL